MKVVVGVVVTAGDASGVPITFPFLAFRLSMINSDSLDDKYSFCRLKRG